MENLTVLCHMKESLPIDQYRVFGQERFVEIVDAALKELNMSLKALRDDDALAGQDAGMDPDAVGSCLKRIHESALIITTKDDVGSAYLLSCRTTIRSDPTWRPTGSALDRITYYVVGWTAKLFEIRNDSLASA